MRSARFCIILRPYSAARRIRDARGGNMEQTPLFSRLRRQLPPTGEAESNAKRVSLSIRLRARFLHSVTRCVRSLGRNDRRRPVRLRGSKKQGSRKSQRSEIFGKRSGRRSGQGGKQSAPPAMAPCQRRAQGDRGEGRGARAPILAFPLGGKVSCGTQDGRRGAFAFLPVILNKRWRSPRAPKDP